MPFPMASCSSRSHSRRRRRTCSPIRRSTRSGKFPSQNIAPPRSSRWTTRRGWRRSKQRSVGGAPIGSGAWVRSHTRLRRTGRRAYTRLKSTSRSHGQRFSPQYALGWRIQRMWRVVARAGRLEAFKKTAAQDGAAREDAMAQRKSLNVNGKAVQVTIDDPDMPLLYALRDNLALHGPRFGCGLAQCGACTVHIDGQAVRSCVTPLPQVTAPRKGVTPQGLGRPPKPRPLSEVDSFLAIDRKGVVTVYSGKVDLGTGVATALPQMVAEELDVALNMIKLVQGDTALTPEQGTTWGSLSVQIGGMQLRNAAATAKAALLDEAAKRLGAKQDELKVVDGVVRAGNKRVSYGELVGGQAFSLQLDHAKPAAGKDPKDYKLVGKPVPRVDIPDKVMGRFTYMQDFRVPGMLHGRVVRPPAIGATLESVDEASIKDVVGVVKVVREGNFLGVVAESEWW